MVQRTRATLVEVLKVTARIILFVGIIFISAFALYPFHDLIGILGYNVPPGFFQTSAADWSLAWVLTNAFLSGLIFGALGKKIDYVFIIIGILIAIWEYTGTENITLPIWFALIGTIVTSNLIGFALKLLRQKFLPKWDL